MFNAQNAIREMNRARPREHVVALAGGLNLSGVTSKIGDGEALTMVNYEVDPNGDYTSVRGFERFDGRPAPSDAEVDPEQFASDELALAELMTIRENRRADIEQVPGSGPVRGAYRFRGEVVAFRDNEAEDACLMYRATENGWVEVSTPVLQPGGRFEFEEIHFAGRVPELIGVDGVNKGFVWDGTNFTQIDNTGMGANDKPFLAKATPAEILFFAYPDGSLQWSALGDPTDFNVATGGGEAALVSDIVGIEVQAKDTIAVYCEKRTYIIRGRVPEQWQIETLFSDSGALKFTTQALGDSIYMDYRGINRLSRVEQFGDFDAAPLSMKVTPLVRSAIGQVLCSVVSHKKNQYMVFLNTGLVITMTIVGGELLGFATTDYGMPFFNASSIRTQDDDERIYVCGFDGFVYELDKGTSFDGLPIESSIRLAYSSFSSETSSALGIRKRLTRVVSQIRATTAVTLRLSPSFDYEDQDIPPHITGVKALGEGAYWGSGTFDQNIWSGALIEEAHFDTRGHGEVVSVLIRAVSEIAAPHTLSTISYRYIPLARRR